MKRTLLGISLAVLLLALINCGRPDPEESCGFVQNSDGQRVSWAGRTPVPLYADATVPDQFIGALKAAITTWEDGALGKDLFDYKGFVATDETPQQDHKNIVYWQPEWLGSSSRQQATTLIFWSGAVITEGDISINAQNFTYGFGTDIDFHELDFESLVLHELGHLLGLKHHDGEGSVMNESLHNGTKRRKLSGDDVAHLRCEY